jgi:hypothetical protein
MRHPDERQIALYAGGETGWFHRLPIARHVAHCPSCSELASRYRSDREAVRQEAQALPRDLNWDRLAAEMTANIRVGLAAGECVSSVRLKHHPIAWRPALAAGGLALVLISGWYLNFPSEQRATLTRRIAQLWSRPVAPNQEAVSLAGISLSATRNGIQVSENGSALTMMHPGTAPAVVIVNTRGSLRARYVDDDTGQVTITNVYSQ